jgi:F0F1-type ATP synthase membrane subunit b/b'
MLQIKKLSLSVIISFALVTGCNNQTKTEQAKEDIETAIEDTKSEIQQSVEQATNSVQKATYDFSNKTKAEIDKMLEESNKLMDDAKAGLEDAEKKVLATSGDAKVEAEKIRDRFRVRVELLSNRIEAIKATNTKTSK